MEKNEADLNVLSCKGIQLSKENQVPTENRIWFFKLNKTEAQAYAQAAEGNQPLVGGREKVGFTYAFIQLCARYDF